MVLKWKDKKDVLMLSTIHDDNTKEIEDQNTRKINPIVCCDYNNTMGGVDFSDVSQHLKMTKKVIPKTILAHFGNGSTECPHFVQKNGRITPRLNFILKLVDCVIENYCQKKDLNYYIFLIHCCILLLDIFQKIFH